MDRTNERLSPMELEHELRNSFMSYAMAVIVTRALPDVRDGLKPVHRRILYAMNDMGMTPDKPFRKSARIVGEVLGKYHPHGDAAVYDAMVRLAQSFSTRYMLVDGQGNFGSVDGDGAAAMRYTEARLSKVALEMVRDIEKETVDFYPNFDETLMQPVVMPSRIPNLLVNGSSGIAVGMATNIPPHNLGEVTDGLVYLIDHPDCTVADLMQFIKGPDFPTGAMILGKNGIYEAYTTGRGRIAVRGKSEIEMMTANRSRIVITSIPYMVNKARLVESIGDLVHEKRLDGISDLRDESDRRGMRIVIELKKDVNPQVVLNYLYKHTQLQDTFGVIMLALVDGQPKLLTLKQVLCHYLDHQKDVIVRRTRYDLDKAEARAHILAGLLIALENIDEVVHIIRDSANANEARPRLMEAFGLSEKQAQAILDMRLARLTGLEREKLQEEMRELEKTIAYLKAVLGDERMVLDIIKTEAQEIRARYADERRTELTALEGEIDPADLIQEEDMVVTLSHFGYVKRCPKTAYRTQNRGGKGVTGMTTREDDYVEQLRVVSTHEDLMFFTNRGRVYTIKCYEIPEAGRVAKGTAIVNLLQLDGGEKVTAMIPVPAQAENCNLVMATRGGLIKKTALSEFANLRKAGLIAIVLRDEDELIGVELTRGDDELLLGTRSGMAIRFPESDIRCMGRATMGVRSIDLAPDDRVIDLCPVSIGTEVLSITENGYGKRTPLDEYRTQSRAGKGVFAFRRTAKTGYLAAQLVVDPAMDLMLITDDGTIIRIPVSAISLVGRNSQGVRLMRLAEGAHVNSVALTFPEEEEAAPAADPAGDPDEAAPEDAGEAPEAGGDTDGTDDTEI